MKILDLLKHRFEMAKSFTKDFQEEVEQGVKDYNADQPSKVPFLNDKDYIDTLNRRYAITIPLIFTNHESMLASLFDRPPEIIIRGRGADDENKKNKLKAAYEYLIDKLDIPTWMTDSAWWFILAGFVSAESSYVKETVDVPMFDEETGEELMDELGEPVMRTKFKYDDPVIQTNNPLKVFFSPESEFSVNGDKIPYKFDKILMNTEEVERTYGTKVKADSQLEIGEEKATSKKESDKEDNKRVQIYRYKGTIPSEYKDEEIEKQEVFEDWDYECEYFVVYSAEKILYAEKIDSKNITLLKWFGSPNKFFGFGIAKLLQPFQKEKSTRRGQMMRYADVAAFPKLAIPLDSDIDDKAVQDPREIPVITFDKEPPKYLTPPDVANIITLTSAEADTDAQRASGMMDISQAGQQTTVDTATGQSIFAEAAERRMRMAKRKYVRFYRESMITILKLAQKYWDEDKLVSITDSEGKTEQVTITRQDLQNIDFDRDVDIDEETLTVNKDVLREQAIALYDKVKDDPLIERKEVFKDVLTEGFNKNDPDRYIKESGLEPGQQLIDAETGQPYIVDDSGEVVPQENMEETAEPKGNGESVPTTQAGVVNR